MRIAGATGNKPDGAGHDRYFMVRAVRRGIICIAPPSLHGLACRFERQSIVDAMRRKA